MPSNWLSQIVITRGQLTAINDEAAGGNTTPTGASPYPSQAGQRFCLGNDANLPSPLKGAIFQYVQFLATMTATPAVGMLAFWSDSDNYVVTCDETDVGDIAGIVVSATTKGNWGIIQIAGKVEVKFRAAITKAAPAIGDLVVAAAAGAGADVATADVLADATSLTSPLAKLILGVAIVSAPAGGASSYVRLGLFGIRANI